MPCFLSKQLLTMKSASILETNIRDVHILTDTNQTTFDTNKVKNY